jgi:hypothetical protein
LNDSKGGDFLAEEKKMFGRSEWTAPPVLFGIGGKWALAVGRIRDAAGTEKVRIAKGQIKGYTKRENGILKCYPNDPMDPIRQQNKLNLKSLQELEFIYKEAKKLLGE